MEASPLNNLPAELRNEVFSLALRETSPIRIACYSTNGRKAYPNNTKCGVVQRTRRNLGALFLTCKQIRSEALPIFYDCNTFDISLVPAEYIHKTSRVPPSQISLPIEIFAKSLGNGTPSNVKIVVDVGAHDLGFINDSPERLAEILIRCSRSFHSRLSGQCQLKFTLNYTNYPLNFYDSEDVHIDLKLHAESANDSLEAICETMAQKWTQLGRSSRIGEDLTFMRGLKNENWSAGEGFKFDGGYSLT